MSSHNKSTGHPIAMSLADLNAWCYTCDSYVISPEIATVYETLHFVKFGSVPGQNIQIETVEGDDKWTLEEREEEVEEVRVKVKRLAELVRNSRHCILFTGAGISTSAKIPDFRGPEGVWTLKAKGLRSESIKLESAIPTLCHMAIVSLRNHFLSSGRTLYIISQNIDGLHRRSGIPGADISELHGNSFKEVCWKCDRDYLRTFDTAAESGLGGQNCPECIVRVPKFCHCTRHKCTCGGTLKDSIIHFGENLPKVDLQRATEHAKSSDLCIVLGSSLTVSPANEMPKYTKKNGGQLCIVNMQTTRLDSTADIRIFAKTDLVLQLLMEELGLTVAEFDVNEFFNE